MSEFIDKRAILLLMLIVVLSTYFIGVHVQKGHNWGGDFALYILQAKHLLQTMSVDDVYHWNKISMQNSIEDLGPYLYPNGFPLLLSVVYSIFGVNLLYMKFFCTLFFLMTLPLIFFLYKGKFKSRISSLIIVSVVAVNYRFVEFSDNVLSDFPFLFFCFLSLCLMNLKQGKWGNQILLGVVIYYTYFIRDIGVFLLPTLFIIQLKMTKNKAGLFCLPYIIFLSLFALVKILFPNGGENHIEMLLSNFSIELISNNYDFYKEFIVNILFFDNATDLLVSIFLIVLLIGCVSSCRRDFAYIVFMCLNIGVLIVWPSIQGVRFLFPIIPFLLYFFIRGGLVIINLCKPYSKTLGFIALIVYFSSYIPHTISNMNELSKKRTNQAYTEEMEVIYNYITKNIHPNEVVGFRKPRVLWLFSNVHCIYIDIDTFTDSIANYLLIYKTPYVEQKSNEFTLVKDFDNYVLLKR